MHIQVVQAFYIALLRKINEQRWLFSSLAKSLFSYQMGIADHSNSYGCGEHVHITIWLHTVTPFLVLKVAEQFSCAVLLMQLSVCTIKVFRKTSMPSIERSLYLLNTCTICVIFLYTWTQCILMALVFYDKDMLEKVTMQRT